MLVGLPLSYRSVKLFQIRRCCGELLLFLYIKEIGTDVCDPQTNNTPPVVVVFNLADLWQKMRRVTIQVCSPKYGLHQQYCL